MNLFKNTLFAMALAATSLTALAHPVDKQTAERVARNFWNAHLQADRHAQTEAMNLFDGRWDAFFIFENASLNGFVIVSADDCLQPVLAYSYTNGVGAKVNREMAWWLDGWQSQIDYLRAEGASADKATAALWNTYAAGTAEHTSLTSKAVPQLLTTTWDQEAPYNNLCPEASFLWWSFPTPVGCVATAMAQVMNYWQHPVRGSGSHTSAFTSLGTLFADFGATVYDWANMPNTLTSVSSAAEQNAVATLMYHCGVATDMEYSIEGSGAMLSPNPAPFYGNALNAMVQYFGYSPEAYGTARKVYSDEQWVAMVRAELDALRPILYAGGDSQSGGHAFVCDGYDDQNRFHFNWGWSGTGDGYYTLANLAPNMNGQTGAGGGSYNFTAAQEAIFGTQPHDDNDSLCFIRQLPYTMPLDNLSGCWTGTDNDGDGYSWLFWDTTAVSTNFALLAYAPWRNTADDHIFSPYIAIPGTYTVAYRCRSFSATNPEYYSLSCGSQQLIADTIASTQWLERSATFTVAPGDTLRLDFRYSGTRSASRGMFLDNITIAAVVGIDQPQASQVTLFPNPTNGRIALRSAQPILRVELLDALGRRLMHTTDNTLDLSAFPNGVYLLRATTASGVETHRVVRAD